MTSEFKNSELVELCCKGNRSAQYRLYEMYSRAMYNICLRMVPSQMEAEDLLQTSFVDVFRKIHSYRGEATIGAWIKRIVINNCINSLKKKKLKTSEWDERYINIPDYSEEKYDPSDVMKIKKAVTELPDGYRIVFSLYAMEGYDHQEIGEILGVTEATSKSQYSRARKKIRELIVHY